MAARTAAWTADVIRIRGGAPDGSMSSSPVRSMVIRASRARPGPAGCPGPAAPRYAVAAGVPNTVPGMPCRSSSAASASTGWTAAPGASRSACSTENIQVTAGAGGLLPGAWPSCLTSWARRSMKYPR